MSEKANLLMKVASLASGPAFIAAGVVMIDMAAPLVREAQASTTTTPGTTLSSGPGVSTPSTTTPTNPTSGPSYNETVKTTKTKHKSTGTGPSVSTKRHTSTTTTTTTNASTNHCNKNEHKKESITYHHHG